MNLDGRSADAARSSPRGNVPTGLYATVGQSIARLVVVVLGLTVSLLSAAPAWAKGPLPASHAHALRQGASLAPVLVLSLALAAPVILITIVVLSARRLPADLSSLPEAAEQARDDEPTRRAA